GNFYTHYNMRASIALGTYLQLQSAEAIYPIYALNQHFFLNQTYVVKYLRKPPVDEFWSLTMYNRDGFLMPKPINRYLINDCGNMTYPDGTLVYNSDSPSDMNKLFYILLQSRDHAVSAEWESPLPLFSPASVDNDVHFHPSWLPTPMGHTSI
ncbi:hypothetical protein DFH08DRAFT_683547, partial [Mycena albidolilacea]